jgi:hypothetical protein
MGTPFPCSKNRVLTLSQLAVLGFRGCDGSLAVCLFDYGFAWRDHENRWEILIRRPSGKFELIIWDKSNTVERKFRRWMLDSDWLRVCNTLGATKAELLSREAPDTLQSLARYYGYENCFGTSSGLLYQINDV